MNCRRAERHLSVLLDGELDARTATEVTDHLARCAPCSRRQRLLARTDQALGSLEADDLSPAFRDRLAHKLLLATQQPSEARAPWPAGRWLPWAVAATLLIGLALLRLDVDQGGGGQPHRAHLESVTPPAPPATAPTAAPFIAPPPSSEDRPVRPERVGPGRAAARRPSPHASEAPRPLAEGQAEPWLASDSPNQDARETRGQLAQPQPVRIDLPGAEGEEWRGGRSPALEAFERRVAARARRAALITDPRRDDE